MAKCSFLIFNPRDLSRVRNAIAQTEWKAHFTDDPSGKFRFMGQGYRHYGEPYVESANPILDDSVPGKLLMLGGREHMAQNIADLIKASCCVLLAWPEKHLAPCSVFDIPSGKADRLFVYEKVFRKPGFYNKFAHDENFPSAVEIASVAWRDEALNYAMLKLYQSYSIESVTPHSTHPRFGQIFRKTSKRYLSHVQTASAINLAFSAIEELKLGINSSRERPRWKPESTYEWNDAVLADIEKRLRNAGIDPQNTIDWVVRGNSPDFKMQPVLDSPTPHHDGKKVKDWRLTIPYAIHACSHIRNYVTAHAFGEEIAQVGPYELFNVQQVARYLILEKCGYLHKGTAATSSPGSAVD
jgi:hypothetical protein